MGVRGPGRIAFLGAPPGSLVKGCHGSSYPISNQTLSEGATYTSGDLRDGTIVPTNAVGLWMILYGQCDLAQKALAIDSADETPDIYSSRIHASVAAGQSCGLVMTRLGTGANAGKVKIKAVAGNWSVIYAWPVGYWT